MAGDPRAMQDFVSDAEILEVVVATYRRLLAAASDPDERGLIVGLMRQAEAWREAKTEQRLALRLRQILH